MHGYMEGWIDGLRDEMIHGWRRYIWWYIWIEGKRDEMTNGWKDERNEEIDE